MYRYLRADIVILIREQGRYWVGLRASSCTLYRIPTYSKVVNFPNFLGYGFFMIGFAEINLPKTANGD